MRSKSSSAIVFVRPTPDASNTPGRIEKAVAGRALSPAGDKSVPRDPVTLPVTPVNTTTYSEPREARPLHYPVVFATLTTEKLMKTNKPASMPAHNNTSPEVTELQAIDLTRLEEVSGGVACACGCGMANCNMQMGGARPAFPSFARR